MGGGTDIKDICVRSNTHSIMIGRVIYANKGVHNQNSYSIRLVEIHANKNVYYQSVIWLVGIIVMGWGFFG